MTFIAATNVYKSHEMEMHLAFIAAWKIQRNVTFRVINVKEVQFYMENLS